MWWREERGREEEWKGAKEREGRKNETEEILEEIMAKTLSKIDKISQPIQPGNLVQELHAG